jgi:Ca2+:H+ antiporter
VFNDSGSVSSSVTTPFTPFTLIFPQWDVYAVLFATFILSYIYIEGKSNYFKGSMLLLAYLILVVAFWFAPLNSVG